MCATSGQMYLILMTLGQFIFIWKMWSIFDLCALMGDIDIFFFSIQFNVIVTVTMSIIRYDIELTYFILKSRKKNFIRWFCISNNIQYTNKRKKEIVNHIIIITEKIWTAAKRKKKNIWICRLHTISNLKFSQFAGRK